jgi:fused signal recognition particle receptor
LRARFVELLRTDNAVRVRVVPRALVIVGVNGVGKTTSAAKLAHYLKSSGESVLLAACDTFRAAATDQLAIWAERVGVDMIRHREGSDRERSRSTRARRPRRARSTPSWSTPPAACTRART